jgi:biotin synthase
MTRAATPGPRSEAATPRSDWTRDEIAALFELPFADLMYRAQSIHRECFDPNEVQMSQLLSIKTGGCQEDCGYCSQSAHFKTGLKASKLMQTEAVLEEARQAKEHGATRFCMGAAWREPKDRDMEGLCNMVAGVKALGLETCMTLGMLTDGQAERLAEAGLDYYNHNLDTSPEYYPEVISTRTYEDRLETLDRVRKSGMSVCCGGIIGMGEERSDRVGLIHSLAGLTPHPESVPVNALMPQQGTPLEGARAVEPLEFVRMIAVARIVMPGSMVRLSAGREAMSDELQALCFLAGANSIFVGDKLLTAGNPGDSRDGRLTQSLGVRAMPLDVETAGKPAETAEA